ncbi:uncharacterized protein BKCO1_13000113 [Diplodia corticola]|uniref:Integral membrane protein n=1 Tax=Diplodia corticola TaxID=236234 RepID=A0A1J9S932_9PEZI|nr:uncharacterized protein BKCO1_13000113 [Diplodia corticola]OJD36093.1 integral membrane protein [Diplodia corticola]
MGGFASIGLVWKFFIVFACLLVLTILAGFCKLLYSRQQLKKHIALKKQQTTAETDNLALNDRERDEGDLFGIRALEAGYYGGVAQSRPTSPTGSSMRASSRHPSVSTNTLIGSAVSQTPKLISPATSVTHLPHGTNASGDAAPKPPSSPPRRNAQLTLRLEPSQAELTGRKNHGVVEVAAQTEASPGEPASPTTPTSPISPKCVSRPDMEPESPIIRISAVSNDRGESSTSPELLRPAVYHPETPQLPVVETVSRISWRPSTADDTAANANSMAASLDYTMGAPSTGSNPSSPARGASPLPSPVRVYPQSYIPRRSRDEARSIFPAESPEPRSRKGSLSSIRSRRAKAEDEGDIPAVPSLEIEANFYILQPSVYVPQHKRDVSASESAYSTDSLRRRSSVSSAETVTGEALPATTKFGLERSDSMSSRRHSIGANSLMPPPSPNPAGTDRFSEFFDAYYRHSQSMVGSEPSVEAVRVETLAIPRHSTIVEVPTPLASPMPDKKRMSVRVTEAEAAF